jgi:hypothetical protein
VPGRAGVEVVGELIGAPPLMARQLSARSHMDATSCGLAVSHQASSNTGTRLAAASSRSWPMRCSSCQALGALARAWLTASRRAATRAGCDRRRGLGELQLALQFLGDPV